MKFMYQLYRVLAGFVATLFLAGCVSVNNGARYGAYAGDLEKVKASIAKGADVNASYENEGTPLHQAAMGNRVEVAEWLLANGASVNATNASGETPLHAAASAGHSNFVAYLISKRADPNARRADGRTPLCFAIFRNSAGTVQSLLDRGADVNTAIPGGITPLHLAVENCLLLGIPTTRTPVIDLLLAAGARPTILVKPPRTFGNIGTTGVMTAGSYAVYAQHIERTGAVQNAASLYEQAAAIYDKIPKALLIQAPRAPKDTEATRAMLSGLSTTMLALGQPGAAGSFIGLELFPQALTAREFKTFSKELAQECRNRAQRLRASGSPTEPNR